MSELYHFIGIGGIGMSALARILLQRGFCVSGSDLSKTPLIDELIALGATIHIGHSKDHLSENATVIYSTDIKQDNPELSIAKSRKQRLLHRSELLGFLLKMQKPLLVTGTHGKTTTSSLLSHVLKEMGYDPSFALGGLLKGSRVNAQHGAGAYFVAEADESDKSFLAYTGYGAIITNIDLDHLNYWHTEEELIKGFDQFARSIENKELLVYCADDERLKKLCLPGVGYGFSQGAEARITAFSQKGLVMAFDLFYKECHYREIQVPLIGQHNALNACSVFVMALLLGAKEEAIKQALSTFPGVHRRADKLAEVSGVRFYDDYGHHPTEVEATIKAFKDSLPNDRLITVFQPHRYTRTRDCFEQFVDAFRHSDVLVLTDLYAASEEPIEGVSSETLYHRIQKKYGENIFYIRKDILPEFLEHFVRPSDVVLTMGAGDVTKIGPLVAGRLHE